VADVDVQEPIAAPSWDELPDMLHQLDTYSIIVRNKFNTARWQRSATVIHREPTISCQLLDRVGARRKVATVEAGPGIEETPSPRDIRGGDLDGEISMGRRARIVPIVLLLTL
jgi:hypothetical protein